MKYKPKNIIITPEIKDILVASYHYFIFLYKYGSDFLSVGGTTNNRIAGEINHNFPDIEMMPYQKTRMYPAEAIRNTIIESFMWRTSVNKFLDNNKGYFSLFFIDGNRKGRVDIEDISRYLKFQEPDPKIQELIKEQQKKVANYVKKSEEEIRKADPEILASLIRLNQGPFHDNLVHPLIGSYAPYLTKDIAVRLFEKLSKKDVDIQLLMKLIQEELEENLRSLSRYNSEIEEILKIRSQYIGDITKRLADDISKGCVDLGKEVSGVTNKYAVNDDDIALVESAFDPNSVEQKIRIVRSTNLNVAELVDIVDRLEQPLNVFVDIETVPCPDYEEIATIIKARKQRDREFIRQAEQGEIKN